MLTTVTSPLGKIPRTEALGFRSSRRAISSNFHFGDLLGEAISEGVGRSGAYKTHDYSSAHLVDFTTRYGSGGYVVGYSSRTSQSSAIGSLPQPSRDTSNAQFRTIDLSCCGSRYRTELCPLAPLPHPAEQWPPGADDQSILAFDRGSLPSP